VAAVDRGESPEAVARVFGVNRSSVYRWLAAARQPDGLAAKRHPGPDPSLSIDQWRILDELLRQGAQAHGWPNRLWTCARVAEVIRRHFGVALHHDHVGRLLHARLNWSPQKPRRRARERDDVAIEQWKTQRFPEIVTAARARGAHVVFLDESGYMLTPTVRRTWAPRGSKPVLDCWDRRDRVSAISAVTVSPRLGRLNLFFDLLPDNKNVKAEQVGNISIVRIGETVQIGYVDQSRDALEQVWAAAQPGGREHGLAAGSHHRGNELLARSSASARLVPQEELAPNGSLRLRPIIGAVVNNSPRCQTSTCS
jgi:transposase